MGQLAGAGWIREIIGKHAMPSMNNLLALALCTGIVAAQSTAKADDIYSLCGVRATGFIRSGGSVACIGEIPLQTVQPLSGSERKQEGVNRNVDTALNSADLAFGRDDARSGCGWVNSAIIADANSSGEGGSSVEQREQLRRYAARCNLRY